MIQRDDKLVVEEAVFKAKELLGGYIVNIEAVADNESVYHIDVNLKGRTTPYLPKRISYSLDNESRLYIDVEHDTLEFQNDKSVFNITNLSLLEACKNGTIKFLPKKRFGIISVGRSISF